jgi:hypothetical protein
MLLQAPLLHEVVNLTMAHASLQDSLTAPRELALTTLSRSNNSRTSCPLCRLQGRVRLSRDGDGTGGVPRRDALLRRRQALQALRPS